jgi:hypothetical protein
LSCNLNTIANCALGIYDVLFGIFDLFNDAENVDSQAHRDKVTLDLEGTSEGDVHPAHIHFNSVAVGGGIAVTLTSVDGESGKSVTVGLYLKRLNRDTRCSSSVRSLACV